MEALPDELNCMIASYFDSGTDSANYRLVSKHFARIGAQEHFHYFQLGNGTDESAISRMQNLVASPHLVKHVKGLDYAEEYEHDDAIHGSQQWNCLSLAHVAKGLSSAGAKLEIVQAQRLRFEFFSARPWVSTCLDAFSHACLHLKEVHFSFDKMRRANLTPRPLADIQRNIRHFLKKLDNLEVLSLWFEEEDFRGWMPGHHLRDIVPIDRTWKRLRSMELRQFWVDERDLVKILRNHEGTGKLKCVHWAGMSFRTPADGEDRGGKKGEKWREVFEQIGKMGLKHGDVCEGHSWAEEVGEWVIKGDDGRETAIKTDLKMCLEGGEDSETGDEQDGDVEEAEEGEE